METKEYLPKYPNEYNFNGKRYIEKIRRCVGMGQDGEDFRLKCRIHQRGKHEYTYTPGTDFIVKQFNDHKAVFLSDEALNSVTTAVREYKEKVADAKQWESVNFSVEGFDFFLSCKQKKDDFIYFLEYSDNERLKNLFYEDEIFGNLHQLLWNMNEILPKKFDDCLSERKYDFTCRNTAENPLYRAALEQGKKILTALLRRYYRIADENECSFLSELLGYRILPSLSEDFNREYIVTNCDVDFKLLDHSGYLLLHTPYFSMMGKTHDKITLNPHHKRGVDSAPADAEAITFRKFMSLFDGENEMIDEN